MAEWVSLAASAASIIIAFVAIAQATYYYTQGKDTSREVAVSLADIKSATHSLEKLSGRYLERLTKHVTEHSTRQHEDVFQLAMLFAEIPRTNAQQVPTAEGLSEAQLQEAISLWIMMHHYTALTNACAQAVLQPVEEIDGSNEIHSGFLLLIDRSYTDFMLFDNLLANVDNETLSKNAHASLYEHTIENQKLSVMNVGQMFISAQTSVGG